MTVDPEVRRALPTDRDECVAIDVDARPVVARQRGGEAWLADHVPLGEFDDWPLTWVGVIDGVVVGFLCGGVAEVPFRGRVFSVDRVYVREEAREIGFGDALIAAAMEHAKFEGCSYFEATALPGDRETKNLFERAGITARSIVVSRRLN